LPEASVTDLGARYEAVIGLAELITVFRVVQEVGEVGEQIEIAGDAEGRDLRAGVILCPLPLERAAVPI
jgi:hypothetical protein